LYSQKKSVFIVLVMVLTMVLVRSPSPTHARFIIASQTWNYPDEYGQGIEYVYFINNIEGVAYNWSYQFWNGTERDSSGNPAGLEFRHGCDISLLARVWLNGTQTGYSYADGRDLYTRVGLEVFHLDILLFAQENMSQAGGSQTDDPMWQYDFTFLLNGDPQYYGPDYQGGLIYTVVFTYEIFFL